MTEQTRHLLIVEDEAPLRHAIAEQLADHGYHVEQAESARREIAARSEEHTSELQSPCNLVCRLLLEKKTRHQLVDHLRDALRVVDGIRLDLADLDIRAPGHYEPVLAPYLERPCWRSETPALSTAARI